MSDAKEKKEEKPAGAPAAPAAPAKSSMKTMLLVVAALLIEGVAISAVFMFSGGPKPVHAEGEVHQAAEDMDRDVEIMVVAEKYQNARQGRVYLYDTEIYIVTKAKHAAQVEEGLKARSAQISTEIGTIIARSDPAQLLSADRATLSRQITALLDELLGPDEAGKSRIGKVLIRKCTQYRL